MKQLKDIERLPVWAVVEGQVRLQWHPTRSVLHRLPQCSVCSFWYAGTASGGGGKCLPCQAGDQWTVGHATAIVLEALTIVKEEADA